MALVCGVNEPTTDRYDALSISVSTLHAIRPEFIQIAAPQSASIQNVFHTITKTAPLGRSVSIPVWNEVVLVPTGFDMSHITCLDDLHRYGGKIISQEFPDCIGCNPAFMWRISVGTPTQ